MLYVALLLYGWLGSEKTMFVPPPPTYRADSSRVKVIKIAVNDHENISAMYFTNTAARFTILYSHGNAEDIGCLTPEFSDIAKAGFNVLAYDYRGYGASDGKPSERAAYRDIDAAFGYLTDVLKIVPSNIVLLGRSVGSGPSVDLAKRQPVAGLIVESGFVSAFRVMTHWRIAPFDRFNNIGKIGDVKCPVLFIHGTVDTIIKPWHAQALYDAANEPKKLVWITGADHNNLMDVAGGKYFQSLHDFALTLHTP